MPLPEEEKLILWQTKPVELTICCSASAVTCTWTVDYYRDRSARAQWTTHHLRLPPHLTLPHGILEVAVSRYTQKDDSLWQYYNQRVGLWTLEVSQQARLLTVRQGCSNFLPFRGWICPVLWSTVCVDHHCVSESNSISFINSVNSFWQ